MGALLLLLVVPSLKWLALPHQDLVLLALGGGFLVVQALLSALVLLRSLLLLVQLRHSTSPLPHGAEAERPYRLPSPVALWRWFPFVQVQWEWVEPQASVELLGPHEQIVLARRGCYSKTIRRFRISDFCGLARIRFERVQHGEFQVLPSAGRLSQQPLMIRWSSGDEVSDPRGEPAGDRVDMRQYSRGDSPRTILWKVYARTRRLMVRVPERALSARPKVCSYLVTGPRDEAAAAVCRVLIESQLLGPEWRFGSDGLPGHDHQRQGALERICRSACSRQPQPHQLQEYLQKAQQDGYAQSVIVLPLDLAGKADELRQVLSRSPVPSHLCLAIDGQPGKARLSWWQRWLEPSAAQDLQSQLQQAADFWKGFPGSISLIDRRSGTLLGDLQQFQRRRPR